MMCSYTDSNKQLRVELLFMQIISQTQKCYLMDSSSSLHLHFSISVQSYSGESNKLHLNANKLKILIALDLSAVFIIVSVVK